MIGKGKEINTDLERIKGEGIRTNFKRSDGYRSLKKRVFGRI